MAGIKVVKIVLFDPEKNIAVETFVSEADAKRAETDIFFATELLTQALNEHPQAASTFTAYASASNNNNEDIPRSVSEDVIADENADEVNLEAAEAEGLYRWTSPAVFLLLETYRTMDEIRTKSKMSQKQMWRKISEELEKKGHTFTGSQCDSKLRSLKKTYKAIKDHNNKSGNDRRTWQYFQVMDEMYGKKAWCDPVAVASSTGLALQKSEINIDTETNTVCPSKSNKTSIATLLAKRLRQKEEHEENKNKRHKERMEIDEKLLKVLEKLAEK